MPISLKSSNIVLIGAMGAGKSTTAPLLAERLEMNWCDIDDEIEKVTSHSGAYIIEHYGINFFRSIEEEVMINCLSMKQTVISTGAGTWTLPIVRQRCIDETIVIWLRVEAEELVRRLRHSDRYLIRLHGPYKIVHEQIATRTQFYSLAHIYIECSSRSPNEIVDNICKSIDILGNKNLYKDNTA